MPQDPAPLANAAEPTDGAPTLVSSQTDMKALLGPPPLLDGENVGAYDALCDRIRSEIAPRDVFEEIWARDLVDNLWLTLRLRRPKSI